MHLPALLWSAARYLPAIVKNLIVLLVVSLSELTSIAMLFVRCRGGISHNPAESVSVEDVDMALEVLERFLFLLSSKNDPNA
jgi:hypothetical protein